ncbi:MAG: TAXI family TRAP transporter solute-binding subunit [Alphaproteobacteria bacterium]
MGTARADTNHRVTRRAFNTLLAAACGALGVGAFRALRPSDGPALADNMHYLRIGTGDVGGVYFRIGGILANVFSDPGYNTDCSDSGLCGVPGLIAISQTTDGSVQNMQLLEDRAIEAALGQADVAYWAFRGEELYAEDPHEHIRGVANLYSEAVHIAVRDDSPVDVVADLRGKRVIVGAKGSGSLIGANIILRAFGLSFDDIEPIYENLARGTGLLRAGEADALFAITGAPAPSLQPLAHDPGFRLLSIDGEPASDVMAVAPFFTRVRIPRDQYAGVGDTPTLAVGAQLFVHADLDDATVYALTRALWHPSNRQVLNNGHQLGQRIMLATALDGMAVPLHPGAQRYYESALQPEVIGSENSGDGAPEAPVGDMPNRTPTD